MITRRGCSRKAKDAASDFVKRVISGKWDDLDPPRTKSPAKKKSASASRGNSPAKSSLPSTTTSAKGRSHSPKTAVPATSKSRSSSPKTAVPATASKSRSNSPKAAVPATSIASKSRSSSPKTAVSTTASKSQSNSPKAAVSTTASKSRSNSPKAAVPATSIASKSRSNSPKTAVPTIASKSRPSSPKPAIESTKNSPKATTVESIISQANMDAEPVKRGRGRPRKTEKNPEVINPPKSGRGRPRKYPVPVEITDRLEAATADAARSEAQDDEDSQSSSSSKKSAKNNSSTKTAQKKDAAAEFPFLSQPGKKGPSSTSSKGDATEKDENPKKWVKLRRSLSEPIVKSTGVADPSTSSVSTVKSLFDISDEIKLEPNFDMADENIPSSSTEVKAVEDIKEEDDMADEVGDLSCEDGHVSYPTESQQAQFFNMFGLVKKCDLKDNSLRNKLHREAGGKLRRVIKPRMDPQMVYRKLTLAKGCVLEGVVLDDLVTKSHLSKDASPKMSQKARLQQAELLKPKPKLLELSKSSVKLTMVELELAEQLLKKGDLVSARQLLFHGKLPDADPPKKKEWLKPPKKKKVPTATLR